MSFDEEYSKIVQKRKDLVIPGYKNLDKVGMDGHWTTPYQKISCNQDNPVFLAYFWLDESPHLHDNKATLQRLGYLPSLGFNQVMDKILSNLNLKRSDIYLTQILHLIPKSASKITISEINHSFENVTAHEIKGREVIALGDKAAKTCQRYGIQHTATISPSKIGVSLDDRVEIISETIRHLF